MKVLKVKNSWFKDSDLRLDAAYHLSDGTITNHKLKSCPYKTLNLQQCAKNIFKGNIFKRVYVDNETNGFPFLTASDMMTAELKAGKYISKKYSDVEHLRLKKGWILISRSGTLGNTVYTNEDFEQFIGTDDLIRIEPDDSIILSGFLYAYLSSKYGYGLLTQSGYGGVIQHIEPHHIESISVPVFPEDKQQLIHQLIVEASELRVEANKLLSKAIQSIENMYRMHLPKNIIGVKTGKVSIKNLLNNGQQRLDSPVYLSSAKNILDKEELEFATISELNFQVFRPGIFKRVKVNSKGIPYIKGSELNKTNPFGNCEYLSRKQTPFLDQLLLKENQILFTCAGTVGDIKMITREYEEKGAIGSQDIIRIEQNGAKLSISYLFAFLKTGFCNDYIQSLKYGSVIERVEPFHVQSIPIIIPEREFEEEIIELISEYNSNSYLSFIKENQAIALIEKEIDLWQVS